MRVLFCRRKRTAEGSYRSMMPVKYQTDIHFTESYRHQPLFETSTSRCCQTEKLSENDQLVPTWQFVALHIPACFCITDDQSHSGRGLLRMRAQYTLGGACAVAAILIFVVTWRSELDDLLGDSRRCVITILNTLLLLITTNHVLTFTSPLWPIRAFACINLLFRNMELLEHFQICLSKHHIS